MKKLSYSNLKKLETIPTGILGVTIFLGASAIIATLAGLSLLLPHKLFDWIWRINPTAHANYMLNAHRYGILFIGLGIVLGIAGWYWFDRREWARKLTILIIAVNIVSNLVHFVDSGRLEIALTGLLGTGLFVYLCSPGVRDYFANRPLRLTLRK